MAGEVYNIYAAIGIGLTFLASIAAVIVSILSFRSTVRNNWSAALRENSSLYFTQIARIYNGQEADLTSINNELIKFHFSIVLLLSKEDKNIHDNMSAIRSKASTIVKQNELIIREYERFRISGFSDEDIENQDVIKNARENIVKLKNSIINKHQGPVFDGIKTLIERAWSKQ